MSELVKIKDVSSRYDITARTLRYYEDMGLITSTRSDDYAYRLYDEETIKKIEQILILRKLNISIKDIKRIFETAGSEVVLEVLGKKVTDIDDEVALLHEMKEIIIEFMQQVEKADFANGDHVKQLYAKAKEIKGQLVNADYSGNPSAVNRIMEISEKLDKKVPDIFVVKIPKCKVVTTGAQTWDNWDMLMSWAWQGDRLTKLFKPFIFDCMDFLLLRGDKAEYIMFPQDHVTPVDVEPFEMCDFEGGLYAMSVTTNDDESYGKVQEKIIKWLATTHFEVDDKRCIMANMAYEDEEVKKGLGYHQAPRYVPIRLKSDMPIQ